MFDEQASNKKEKATVFSNLSINYSVPIIIDAILERRKVVNHRETTLFIRCTPEP